MMVRVKLLGSFAKFGKHLDDGMMAVEKGIRIRDIVEILKMPSENIMLILVNGVSATLDTELSEGNTVQIFPPVGGG